MNNPKIATYALAPDIIAFSTERDCLHPENAYDGFNITPYTGDDAAHVESCRQQLCRQLDIPDSHLLLPHQVHGTRIQEVTTDNLQARFEDTDGLITLLPNICIGVSTADCVPLLMHDTQTGAIAAIHAGWRGTVRRIGVLALGALFDAFGTRPEHVQCVIGPSIGPDAFEVGDEVVDAFAAAGFLISAITHRVNKKWHIDLLRANAWQLERAGIIAGNIQRADLCTYTHYTRFFSARRLGIASGRIFTGIMRREQA